MRDKDTLMLESIYERGLPTWMEIDDNFYKFLRRMDRQYEDNSNVYNEVKYQLETMIEMNADELATTHINLNVPYSLYVFDIGDGKYRVSVSRFKRRLGYANYDKRNVEGLLKRFVGASDIVRDMLNHMLEYPLGGVILNLEDDHMTSYKQLKRAPNLIYGKFANKG